MALVRRKLGITQQPMGPTAGGMGDLYVNVAPANIALPPAASTDAIITPPAPAPAAAAAPAPSAFDAFWNTWGATIGGLATLFFVALAIPGRGQKA
jgi:hypothetical protein